jgi:hypothetical protein
MARYRIGGGHTTRRHMRRTLAIAPLMDIRISGLITMW